MSETRIIVTYNPKKLMSRKAQYDYVSAEEKRVRINLKVGDNQITSEQLAGLETNPMFVAHLESGILTKTEISLETKTAAKPAKVTQSTTSPARTKARKTKAIA